ncbi:MAG: SPOR domain-containing protein [Bacteroidales bacterium]
MKKFLAHIEFLLKGQSHVIIPGLGVFICEYKSANIEEDGTITAPSNEIRFNTQVTHDDNALALSIANLEDISLEEAKNYIRLMVKDLIWTLSIEPEIQLGHIGRLYIENSEIVFTANNKGVHNLNHFGLKALNLKQIEIIEDEKAAPAPVISESKERIHISINKKTLRYTASVAAAILLFFLFSAPVSQHNRNINYAGIISSEIFSHKQIENTLDTLNFQPESAISASVGAIPKSISEVDKSLTDTQNKEILRKPVSETDKYYIIVNSFPNKNETERYLKDLHNQGFTSAALLEKGNRSRIYIKSFSADKRNEAQTELNKLRKTSKFADAWIYNLNS